MLFAWPLGCPLAAPNACLLKYTVAGIISSKNYIATTFRYCEHGIVFAVRGYILFGFLRMA